ncbi:uncharacterized protein TRIADDRAFT_58841 [Trichoplax adhaerens]|uniref:Uncharacterized protein n=1 Tax=Trichoplax adhaerens TaxID=10228 RepID=B3S3T7_TRIAD|nr:predicted protein [Trichoplax adhaerens]EDV22341.1 predicted protein [Trichoplax adhaerens]|eukprot:XP_002114885.1 predicted protein [Trichoplax adhaerens]
MASFKGIPMTVGFKTVKTKPKDTVINTVAHKMRTVLLRSGPYQTRKGYARCHTEHSNKLRMRTVPLRLGPWLNKEVNTQDVIRTTVTLSLSNKEGKMQDVIRSAVRRPLSNKEGEYARCHTEHSNKKRKMSASVESSRKRRASSKDTCNSHSVDDQADSIGIFMRVDMEVDNFKEQYNKESLTEVMAGIKNVCQQLTKDEWKYRPINEII